MPLSNAGGDDAQVVGACLSVVRAMLRRLSRSRRVTYEDATSETSDSTTSGAPSPTASSSARAASLARRYFPPQIDLVKRIDPAAEEVVGVAAARRVGDLLAGPEAQRVDPEVHHGGTGRRA
jgi:hypothetical protein